MRSRDRLVDKHRAGALFGIISADDIINLLANELSLMAAVLVEQTAKERHLRK